MKSLGLQTNPTATQEERAARFGGDPPHRKSGVSTPRVCGLDRRPLRVSRRAAVASDEKLESVSLAVRESAEATQTYLEEPSRVGREV